MGLSPLLKLSFVKILLSCSFVESLLIKMIVFIGVL